VETKREGLLNIPTHYFNRSHEKCGDWCGAKKDPDYRPKLPYKKWLTGTLYFFHFFHPLTHSFFPEVKIIIQEGDKETERSLSNDILDAITMYSDIKLLELVNQKVFFLIFNFIHYQYNKVAGQHPKK